ncbi:Scr1 family TA system antitoxin-like transcriptional regulator, partial [Actinomadura sp. RB99]|uniref:Scr1 family TA system antitoxin-like transcriptional regulator n=1 Tax=Actinomadura sp. RB99 TaxID=2691577 RepID=UPI0016888B5C
MAARKPTSKTVAFGAEVTRLREEAGLNRTELAARSAVTRSYISQVESGRTKCRRDFAERLDKALDTGTALVDAWDELLRSSSYPKFFADFPRAEASADALRAFETRIVYGLLQTEAYARVILSNDEAVLDRLRRQSVITKPNAPTVFVVLVFRSNSFFSFDFGDDLVGVFGPGEWFAAVVPAVDEGADR